MLVKRLDSRSSKGLTNAEWSGNAAAVNHEVGGTVNKKMLVRLFGLTIKSILREKHS